MPYALTPARVHDRAYQLCGHQPAWIRQPYRGGIYHCEHFRVCSYCGCVHPLDLLELLHAGEARLEPTAKPDKYLLLTPNPVAGKVVRMGSMPGPVFTPDGQPADLVSRLLLAAKPGLEPTITERLAEHYDRPCFEPAPAFIRQPFYSEHTTQLQWAEIEAAAQGE